MKLRIDNETYARLTKLHQAMAMSHAEIVRRCLRWYYKGAVALSVVKVQSRKPTTRRESEAYEIYLGNLQRNLSAREILGIVRARMETINWEQIDAEIENKQG